MHLTPRLRLIRACSLLLVTLITACAQQTIQPEKPIDTSLSPPDQWSIKAKLGIRTPEDSGSVSLNWVQQHQSYTIRIQGPLGQGKATITGTPEFVTIKQPGKQALQSNQPDTLTEQVFGWSLPIHDLSYWVRGLANPEQAISKATFDEFGLMKTLEQSGWRLDYSRYQQSGLWLLPGRIRAQHDDTQFTLIIREWQHL